MFGKAHQDIFDLVLKGDGRTCSVFIEHESDLRFQNLGDAIQGARRGEIKAPLPAHAPRICVIAGKRNSQSTVIGPARLGAGDIQVDDLIVLVIGVTADRRGARTVRIFDIGAAKIGTCDGSGCGGQLLLTRVIGRGHVPRVLGFLTGCREQLHEQ